MFAVYPMPENWGAVEVCVATCEDGYRPLILDKCKVSSARSLKRVCGPKCISYP